MMEFGLWGSEMSVDEIGMWGGKMMKEEEVERCLVGKGG